MRVRDYSLGNFRASNASFKEQILASSNMRFDLYQVTVLNIACHRIHRVQFLLDDKIAFALAPFRSYN